MSEFKVTDDQSKLVKIPKRIDKVYKDECMLSYDNPESENGLYISLATFYGFGRDYVELYTSKTNHKVFLHYKRLKKELPNTTEDDGPEKKITRLAIGIEGGFKADSGPRYEYTDLYHIVLVPEFISVPLDDPSLPPLVKQSAEAVIASESSFKQAELDLLNATWDGEARQISKHAFDLFQMDNGKKLPYSGWQCEKCELKENLWLNLSDGSVLCGRKRFDGSGGNNHGVEHYETTRYPLAVKLGTITKDGKADVYSYEEDDMVLDPYLKEHLAHFGLDINLLDKTEKSMAELEIDLNQRISEWETCQESGSALVPVYGPGRTGMVNLGNSCYINSLMQVVFTIPDFINRFVHQYPEMTDAFDFTNDAANDFMLQMGKLGFGLCSGKYSQPPPENAKDKEQRGISCKMFKHVVAANNRSFLSNQQQDVQDFFLHVINVLERNKKRSRNPADCFKFQVEDRYECSESGKVRYTNRVEYCLPLPIPLEEAINEEAVKEYEERKKENPRLEIVRPRIQMSACIASLAATELIDEFYSSALKRKTTAKKTTRLVTFPDYLMIHLKKFTLKDYETVKLDVSVEMQDQVDLTSLKGFGVRPEEELLPDNPEELPEVKLNQEVVDALVEFQVPLEAAKKAAFFTKGGSLEEAYNWYEQHLLDADLLAPFIPPGYSKPVSKKVNVSEESVEMLMSMGFSRQRALKALQETENNLERACDWIFSHPDDGGDSPMDTESDQQQETFNNGSPSYRLRGFITHMGTSANVGHYVCHILKDGQWLIYNDNKVALSVNPPKDLGYLYLYERLDVKNCAY